MTALKPARQFDSAAETVPVSPLQPSVEFAADDFQLTPAEQIVLKEAGFSWRWKLALLLLVALVLLSAGLWLNFLTESWQQTPLLAVVYSIISAAVLVLIGSLLWREWRLWQKLRQIRQWHSSAERIKHSVQFGEADRLCLTIAAQLAPTDEVNANIALWRNAVTAEHSDQEQLQLFEQLVLSATDKQARKLIQHAAVDTSLAVAISPFALADMLLVLWRSSRLLRELSILYGTPAGKLRSMLMLKRVLTALFWAGGSEIALDMASDVMSSELTAKLSVRAGQGVIAGLLVARIGNLAQQQLRPLPASQLTKVSLKELAENLFSRFKTRP